MMKKVTILSRLPISLGGVAESISHRPSKSDTENHGVRRRVCRLCVLLITVC